MTLGRPSKSTIELCEYASVNADGTHTLLRAGIDKWTATIPADILLYAFVEFGTEQGTGRQLLEVKVCDPDGVEVQIGLGALDVPATGRAVYSIPLQAHLTRAGKWEFRVFAGQTSLVATLDMITKQ